MSTNINNNVVVVEQDRQPVAIGLFAVLLLAAFVGLVIAYFWQILVISGLLLAAVWVSRSFDAQRRREQAICDRADRQDRLYLEGDPRGIFGESYEGPKCRT